MKPLFEEQHAARPGVAVEAAGTSSQGAPKQAWYWRRPLAVYIILALSLLQWLAIVVELVRVWPGIYELLRTGAVSVASFLGGFLHPLASLAGSVCLLFMRKAALVFFGACILIGLYKTLNQYAYVDLVGLALCVGIFIYCLRLRSQGRLR